MLKNMFLLNIDFYVFFANFCDFGSILEAWAPPKNLEKLKNREKSDVGSHLERIGCFMVALGGFGERFGNVLGRFWEGLGIVAAQRSCLRTKLSATFEQPNF